jgi:hypothetical protein
MDNIVRKVHATSIRFADAASSASKNTLREIMMERESARLHRWRT